MRPRCFLVLVVLTLALCCCSLANAEDIKNPETDSNRAVTKVSNVKRYLKGSKPTAEVLNEERGAFTSIKTLLQKIPYVEPLKNMVKENPALAQAKVFLSKHPRLRAASLIVKGQLKPLAIIGAVALTGGYIMYLVKG